MLVLGLFRGGIPWVSRYLRTSPDHKNVDKQGLFGLFQLQVSLLFLNHQPLFIASFRKELALYSFLIGQGGCYIFFQIEGQPLDTLTRLRQRRLLFRLALGSKCSRWRVPLEASLCSNNALVRAILHGTTPHSWLLRFVPKSKFTHSAGCSPTFVQLRPSTYIDLPMCV